MSEGRSGTARRLLAYGACAAALLGAIGFAHYIHESQRRERDAAEDLGVLAEFEARQIASWRRERIGDASLHTEALLIVGRVQQVLDGSAPGLVAETANWLAKLRESYGYTQAFLVDAAGRPVVASGAEAGSLPDSAADLARRALTETQPVSRLDRGPGGGPLGLLVASALRVADGQAPPGALVLRMDVEPQLLVPRLATAPLGPTAETFLIRHEGDDVVFLTPLRHDPPLPLRLPRTTPDLVGAAATAPDAPASVRGRDYAGTPVLAAARRVPGTDWFALAKLDRSAIAWPARRQAALLAASTGAVLLVAGLLAALLSLRSREARRLAHERERHRRREAELRSAYLSQFAPDAILLADEDAKVLDANERALEMFGAVRGDLIGRHGSALFAEPDRARFDELRERALAGEAIEARAVRDDGSAFPVETTARRIEFEGTPYLVAVVRDVSERRAAAAALEAANRRFRAVFENANDAILLVDGVRIVECNERAAELLGRPRRELLAHGLDGSELEAGICQRARDSVDRRSGGAVVFSQRLGGRDGPGREVEVSVSRLDLDQRDLTLVVARDVSERRRFEQRERQAQKMEALGQLAGGIAHDFNNLLTAIVGHSEILELEIPETDPSQREMLAEIRHSAELGASLTRKLLAFSRGQELRLRVVEVNEAIRSVERLLRPLVGESVALRLRLAGEPLRVRIDRGQFEQILVNLAVNARDAMPEGGTLTFHTASVGASVGGAVGGAVGPQGASGAGAGRVRIRVCDTGVGMDEAVRIRALEPFFTTKEPGRGTGLGLATVYGIVRQSGGELSLHSGPGRGTTVEIVLPRTHEASVDEPTAPRRVSGGSESLLLVDDSAAVRRVTVAALESAGYRVEATTAPHEAFQRMEKDPERFDLVITDVVMPGMSGIELVRRLRGLRPDLRVLYVSGYAPEEILARAPDDEPVDLVPKPFTPALLTERVRRALDRP